QLHHPGHGHRGEDRYDPRCQSDGAGHPVSGARTMSLRTLSCCAALLACLAGGAAAAHAQSQESVVGGGERLTAGGDINANYLGYGKLWIGGAGASVDANVNWRLGLEGEANFTFY